MGALKASKFRYLGDSLFLAAIALYALNRWLIKPHVHSAFMRFHFNDCLLIPAALPPLLFVQRRLKLRPHNEMPTAAEITLYAVFWSILFEVIGPHLFHRATGDVWDAVAYICGAILAWLWWHRQRLTNSALAHEL